ncbi:hypothetical protein K4K52_003328 [Colletotrichum sp. SAR 10_76]|nr:hypothetical protein K4K52_003328 [Colletotrichum sp. SAR 10_76]
MAEVAGLALSGVALASLVTSCIDILEYWDDGRFWINDLGLALTKVSLLKARISQLGNVLPAAANEEGDEHSTCHVALQGLSGVDAVLRQTNELCQRRLSTPPQAN